MSKCKKISGSGNGKMGLGGGETGSSSGGSRGKKLKPCSGEDYLSSGGVAEKEALLSDGTSIEAAAKRLRLALKKTQRREVRLLEGERVILGLDSHKESYHLTAIGDGERLVSDWHQPADSAALLKRLEQFGKAIVLIVLEASTGAHPLCRFLRAAGYRAEEVAPTRLVKAPGVFPKNDRLDALRLALLAKRRMISHFVKVPTPEQESERLVLRQRTETMAATREVKVKIKAILREFGEKFPHPEERWTLAAKAALKWMTQDEERNADFRLALKLLLERLETLDKQVLQLTARIREISQREAHQEASARLRQVPGVGLLVSMSFMLEVLSPERFDDARQMGRFVGLAPGVHQSGDTQRRMPIDRSGNGRLRTLLVEAAWRWCALDPYARAIFDRMVKRGKKKTIANTAMARRLACLLWKLLVSGENYAPEKLGAGKNVA